MHMYIKMTKLDVRSYVRMYGTAQLQSNTRARVPHVSFTQVLQLYELLLAPINKHFHIYSLGFHKVMVVSWLSGIA